MKRFILEKSEKYKNNTVEPDENELQRISDELAASGVVLIYGNSGVKMIVGSAPEHWEVDL
jgi:hypothetical protein